MQESLLNFFAVDKDFLDFYILKPFLVAALVYNVYNFARLFTRFKLFVLGDSVVDITTLSIRQDTLSKISLEFVKTFALGVVWLFFFFEDAVLNLLALYGVLIVTTTLIVNSINNVYGVVYRAIDVVDELHVFSLYLRPFASDDMRVSKRQEKWFCKEADRYFKLYAIGNPGKVMPSVGAESIFAEDATWKNDVEQLMGKAMYIILRVGDTEGSKWELERDVDNQLVKKTIFLIDNQEAFEVFNSMIQHEIPYNLEMPINGTLAVYFDEKNNHWISKKIVSRKDVKTLMLEYIESHLECSEVYNEFIEKKKHMLRYLFNSSNFPNDFGELRWGALMNPIMFSKVNKMSFFYVACVIFWVLASLAVVFSYILDGRGIILFCWLMFTLLLILLAILLILGPKIAWLSRIWPSEHVYMYENAIIQLMMTDFNKSYCVFLLMPYVIYYVVKLLFL